MLPQPLQTSGVGQARSDKTKAGGEGIARCGFEAGAALCADVNDFPLTAPKYQK